MAHLTSDELNYRISDHEKIVTPGDVYYHYKNPTHFYEIMSLCLIEASDEVGVLYKPLYDNVGERHAFSLPDNKILWLRPINNFLEEVEFEGEKVKRFTKLEINYKKAACLIFDKESRLMIVREKGQSEFFALGGTIKDSENGEQAAIRELKEETGIETKIKPIFLFNMPPFPAATDKTKFVRHSCYLINTDQEPVAQNEIDEIVWVSRADFENKKYNLSLALEKLVEKLVNDGLIK
jgi:8-oxo-dGTP pyrophosphatase MutT (NUDIX family)